jgi:5-enolpyruvylshikimate-3-phosphate synthase
MTLQEKVALRYSISLLRKMGCDVMENGDSLFVPGSELGVAQLRPSSAESGLTAVLAASRNASAEVLGVEMVTNRYPGITSELKSIGLDLCLNEDDEQVFLLRVD